MGESDSVAELQRQQGVPCLAHKAAQSVIGSAVSSKFQALREVLVVICLAITDSNWSVNLSHVAAQLARSYVSSAVADAKIFWLSLSSFLPLPAGLQPAQEIRAPAQEHDAGRSGHICDRPQVLLPALPQFSRGHVRKHVKARHCSAACSQSWPGPSQ